MPEPRLVIVGAGVGGIAMAYNLKAIGFHNFVMYEREKEFGGTWFVNTYPGVGCDVDSHYYSFSFNLKHDWSRRFAPQEEILEYVRETVDKFGIGGHIQTSIDVLGAEWRGKYWHIKLRNNVTGVEFTRDAEMFISAVGVFRDPKDCNIPSIDKFQGKVVHTAKWDNSIDLTGKKVAVVGNGCSAAQLVPTIAPRVESVTQFQRTPQWFFIRPNRKFTTIEKFAFNYLPLWERLYRLWLFYDTDSLHALYLSDTPYQRNSRAKVQNIAKQYMLKTAPKKYHDILLPDFPLGCKRRIFDPGYLESLHRDNVVLTTNRIIEFTETGLRTEKGDMDFDLVVLATGYKIQEFLQPMHIVGKNGVSINQHWKESGGAQAYKGAFLSGFPNFGIIFGPNSFPAHNSVLFTNEVSCQYIVKTIVKPIINNDFKVIDVKEAAEMYDAKHNQLKLKGTVWNKSCASWNVDETGRNTTSYHDYAFMFWMRQLWPKWKDFEIEGGKESIPTHPFIKLLRYFGATGLFALAGYFFNAQLLKRSNAISFTKSIF